LSGPRQPLTIRRVGRYQRLRLHYGCAAAGDRVERTLLDEDMDRALHGHPAHAGVLHECPDGGDAAPGG